MVKEDKDNATGNVGQGAEASRDNTLEGRLVSFKQNDLWRLGIDIVLSEDDGTIIGTEFHPKHAPHRNYVEGLLKLGQRIRLSGYKPQTSYEQVIGDYYTQIQILEQPSNENPAT